MNSLKLIKMKIKTNQKQEKNVLLFEKELERAADKLVSSLSTTASGANRKLSNKVRTVTEASKG